MFPGPLEKKLYALYNFLVFYNLKSSLKSTTNREYHFLVNVILCMWLH